jgi:uncharacterized membrane protein (DUF4010 family)
MIYLDFIPEELTQFLQVALFSLIIGLALRRLHSSKEEFRVFGTDRTFTFIGILGYLLFIFDTETLVPYLGGGFVIAGLLGIYYYQKMRDHQDYGLTTIIVALITYCIAPLVITQPAWLYVLVIVIVLILTEMKSSFVRISKKFDKDEFVILAKFLAIAGVILPIIPDEPVVPYLPITPFNVWAAVVVISGLSYLSYLLRKFVLADSGIMISGLLAGLYSSTVATIILARKSRDHQQQMPVYAAAIMLSIGMMYLRILILMLIFFSELAIQVLPWFLILTLVSFGTGLVIYQKNKWKARDNLEGPIVDKNPLEFKVAIIFTLLFIAFSFITYHVIESFGIAGLNVLSWIVGVTDIDPFLLNLFQGGFAVDTRAIAMATMQAIISNNIMKAVYAAFLGRGKLPVITGAGIGVIIFVNAIVIFLIF